MRSVALLAVMVAGAVTLGASLGAQQPPPAQTPPPRPNPIPLPKGATQPTPTSKPAATDAAKPAGGSQDLGSIDTRLAGISGYPGAEFLAAYDAGSNQKLFMFGTNETYEAVLAFYKTQFRKSGEEVSRQPRIQQFDLPGYNSGTMSQRPSVIVKDYTLPDPAGYLHVSGTTERRFKTVIEIIPAGKQAAER